MSRIKKFITKNREIIYLTAKNITLVYFFLFIIDSVKLFPITWFINLDLLFIITLFIDIIALVIYFSRQQTIFKKNILKYKQILIGVFIFIFLFICSTQILNYSNNLWIKKIIEFYYTIQGKLLIFTIAISALIFYLNREKIDADLEKGKSQEQSAEQKRRKEFDKKYKKWKPKKIKLDIPFNIIFSLVCLPFFIFHSLIFNSIRWLYKEKWQYSIGLISLLGIGAFLRIYNLGKFGMIMDEVYTGAAMKGFFQVGRPVFIDGTLYSSAALVAWLGSLLSHIFQNPELSLRLVSALSSIAVIFILYKLGKLLINKQLGILSAFLWTFSTWSVEFARWGREYGFMAFLYVLFFYELFLYGKNKKKKDLIISIIIIFLGFLTSDFTYFMLACLIIYLYIDLLASKVNIRKNILFFLSPIFIFILYFFLIHLREIITATPQNFLYPINRIIFLFNELKHYNVYFIDVYRNNLMPVFLSFFIFPIFLFFTFKNTKQIKNRILLIFGSLGGLIFIAHFHLGGVSRYLFPILPISLIVFCYTFILVCSILNKKLKAVFFIFAVFSIIFFQLFSAFKIPFKDYGDKYENIHFAPTRAFPTYPNGKDPVLYVKNHKQPNDLLITNLYFAYYFYTDAEADYWLRPGKPYFVKDDKTKIAIYSNQTKQINTYPELINIIENTESKTVWLAFNLSGDTASVSQEISACLTNLKKTYNVKLVFEGQKDKGAIVYKLIK